MLIITPKEMMVPVEEILSSVSRKRGANGEGVCLQCLLDEGLEHVQGCLVLALPDGFADAGPAGI